MLLSLVRRYDQIPWLHEIRQTIRRWWNIEIIYLDVEDRPVFLAEQPAGLGNRICALCLGLDEGPCLASMKRARVELERLGPSGELPCTTCHLGMSNRVIPVLIEESSGVLYTTGFFERPNDPDEEHRLGDRALHLSPELGTARVWATVPVLQTESLRQLDDLLRLGASAIGTLFSELHAKEEEIASLRERLKERRGFAGLVGQSASMQEVYRLVERVAANDCAVIIRGESGTGKELVATAIHGLSRREGGPFVVQNCSAFNDNLLESELFGHVRGSFTDAVADKKGLFEVANGGTLFLDEVAEMSPALQAKLLRVLQDQSFWPVGATAPRQADVRIVAATHRDLEAMIQQGRFREDLYYRLNVISISMPPLRERRGDIPALVEHFLKQHGAHITGEALRLLCDHDWPGNVRELHNEIERMLVLDNGQKILGKELISPRLLQEMGRPRLVSNGTLKEAIEELEVRMIQQALAQTSGNRSRAARLLGMARSNFLVKLKAYGIE